MQYYINSRPLTYVKNLEHDLTFKEDKNYLFDLSYLNSIYVQGEHAAKFLQGQLSCDVNQVHSQQMRQGTVCNLKGRILALLDIIDWHGMQLILPKDLSATTVATLNKTAMFSKVELKPNDSVKLFGFYYQNVQDFIPSGITLPSLPLAITVEDDYCCYSLGENIFIIVIKKDKCKQIINSFENNKQYRGSLAWHFLQLHHNQFELYPETSGLFLPHRVGLQNTGHISFDKGCYKGQEVIARIHFRSKVKHTAKTFEIDSPAASIQSGLKLLHIDTKQEVGEIIDYCPISETRLLIIASVLNDHPHECLLEDKSSIINLSRQHTI